MSHGIGPWIEADVPGFAVAYVRAANDAAAAEFYGWETLMRNKEKGVKYE